MGPELRYPHPPPHSFGRPAAPHAPPRRATAAVWGGSGGAAPPARSTAGGRSPAPVVRKAFIGHHRQPSARGPVGPYKRGSFGAGMRRSAGIKGRSGAERSGARRGENRGAALRAPRCVGSAGRLRGGPDCGGTEGGVEGDGAHTELRADTDTETRTGADGPNGHRQNRGWTQRAQTEPGMDPKGTDRPGDTDGPKGHRQSRGCGWTQWAQSGGHRRTQWAQTDPGMDPEMWMDPMGTDRAGDGPKGHRQTWGRTRGRKWTQRAQTEPGT